MTHQMARAAGAAVIGLIVATCSSCSSTSASGTPASRPASSSAAASPAYASPGSSAASGQAGSAAVVSLRAVSGIPGKALAGRDGRTLYLFEADKNGKSACTGACAAGWPPDTVTGAPHAGSGVNQALLGTVKRPDGSIQVTYNGHPLYYFAGDSSAGTAKGEGSKAFGAGWYVVSARGSKIDTD